jgi:protein-S-isoprenylcysteine O-methyltransferase Ste14
MRRRYLFPQAYAKRIHKLRVPFGFVMVALFLLLSEPTLWTVAIGFAISLPGLLLRAWAAGHLRKNLKLTTSGPYAFVRNPLYIGTATVGAGLMAASQSWVLAAYFAGYFTLFFLPVVEQEEQHLRKLFPEYEDYAERVPMLLPRFPPLKGEGRFAFSQYRLNREYQGAMGMLAGFAILTLKAFLLPGN